MQANKKRVPTAIAQVSQDKLPSEQIILDVEEPPRQDAIAINADDKLSAWKKAKKNR